MGLLEELAVRADVPGVPWLGIILAFIVGSYTFEQWLARRQYDVYFAEAPPAALADVIDRDTFTRSQAYSRAKAKFAAVSDAYTLVQNLVILGGSGLPRLWAVSGSLLDRAGPWVGRWHGEIMQSCIFVAIWTLVLTALSLPFSYYRAFVLEAHFGFNKQTHSIFVRDTAISLVLGLGIGMPVLAAFLKIINYFGANFFYYLWVFCVAFQIVMTTVYPTLIQPLFNKLTPLPDGELRTQVEALARTQHFPLKHLYVIDGSKRSSHSNAYFYGLPWSKQIVLFDTLIDQSTTEEVVAVLAHELGHWALWHTSKMLVIGLTQMFIIFALFSAFIRNASFYTAFGFPSPLDRPIIIGFILYSDVLAPVDSVLTFLINGLTRKHEYEADEFAKRLGRADALAEALIKLQKENLSAMDADPLYSAYHHSHPILAHRLEALGHVAKKAQ